MADMKQWRCNGGHVLGVISINRVNGFQTPKLMLYRNAVDLSAEQPKQVDVIGPVWGRITIRCDVENCDSVTTWKPNEEVMKQLLLDLSDSEFQEVLDKVHRVRETEHARRVKKQSLYE